MPDPTEEVKKFYNDYLKSPNYKKRLLKQGYTNPDLVINDRLKQLNKSKTIIADTLGEGSYYDPVGSKALIDVNDVKKYNVPLDNLVAHEYSHSSGSLKKTKYFNPQNLGLNTNEINLINSKNNLSSYTEDYIKGKVPLNPENIHDSQPTELKADIDTLRYNLQKDKIYDTKNQDFDQKFLDKSKKQYKDNKEMQRVFNRVKDTDLINIMNNVASNQNEEQVIAKNGATISWLSKYEEGGIMTNWLNKY